MVILKKVRASTLMETLVATVLIVVIFMISSMILNNLFSNTIKSNTRVIDAYANELEYLYKNDRLRLPYNDDFKSWTISVESHLENTESLILFEAIHTQTQQSITKEIIAN